MVFWKPAPQSTETLWLPWVSRGAFAVFSPHGATLRRRAAAAALAGRRALCLSLCGAVSGRPREGTSGLALCRSLRQAAARTKAEGRVPAWERGRSGESPVEIGEFERRRRGEAGRS